MSALVASVAAYTVLLTLLIACGEHLSKPAALSTALAAHRVVPAPSTVAAVVIATEGLLGAAGVVALLRDDGGRLLGVVLAGSAALLATYAGYGLYVRSTGRAVPCGCSRVELPMTGWVVARASTLAGMALIGSFLSGADMKLGLSGRRQHRGEALMKTVATGPGGYAAGLSSTVYPRDSILRLSLAARVSGFSSRRV